LKISVKLGYLSANYETKISFNKNVFKKILKDFFNIKNLYKHDRQPVAVYHATLLVRFRSLITLPWLMQAINVVPNKK